jgi:hypothetical protein
VRPLLNGHSHQPHTMSPVGHIDIGNNAVRSLVDAQSAPNGVVPPEESPLTQNYPSKCCIHKI